LGKRRGVVPREEIGRPIDNSLNTSPPTKHWENTGPFKSAIGINSTKVEKIRRKSNEIQQYSFAEIQCFCKLYLSARKTTYSFGPSDFLVLIIIIIIIIIASSDY